MFTRKPLRCAGIGKPGICGVQQVVARQPFAKQPMRVRQIGVIGNRAQQRNSSRRANGWQMNKANVGRHLIDSDILALTMNREVNFLRESCCDQRNALPEFYVAASIAPTFQINQNTNP